MTCIKNELRIVRGNAFAVRMTIEARRLDGTVIEDFDLSQAEATLNVLHAGKKTASTFTVTGNDATIAFNGTQGLGWYGLEMAGTYQGSPWRWCVDEIFQIVETNAKANVPSWTILADTTYLVDGVLTIASAADAVQADWNETNPQSAAYIKNKPAVVSPTQLQQAVNAEKERAEAAERANADAIGAEETRAKTAEQANANAIAAKYTKPSGGIPSTDMTEAVQTSLQKADNAAPQSTTYTKDEVQQLITPFITKSVDDLVNYYLKSEVYTQSEVQQLIAAVSQFRYQLEQTLPTASADTMGIIYLVPSTNPKQANVKDEYITIDNGAEAQTRYTWEQIGSTAIDLSGYYTSAQTDTAITNALNAALASYYTKTQVDSMVQTINQAIAAKYTKPSGGIPSTDMTEAVQTSLQKADNAAPQSTTYTKDEVQQLIAPKVNEAQEKTWAQLKQLRDDNELMPGQWYRIIDFVTTINTSMYDQMRSAGHAFDIMVMALTPSTLCETAFAIQHAGDTYFIGSRLQAWKLKYNIDNVDWSAQAGTYAADNNGYRFHKEGTIDIGGVTYILWKGNQAYYDDWDWYAVSLNEEVGTDMLCYYPDDDPENFDVTGQIESVTTSTVNGKGTILSMCDEHNVEHTYDFKNIQFKRWKVTDDLNRSSFNGKYLGIVNRLPDHLTIEDESDFIWAYTYAVYDYNEDTGDTTDNSLSGNVEKVTSTVSVSNNVVCVWDTENTYTVYGLSITGSVTDTTFSGDVQNCTFSGDVLRCTFSGSVSNNTFSGSVSNSTFSGYLDRCTFSGSVSNNTFSGSVSNNTFSGELYNSTFSGDVRTSTFSGSVRTSTFSGYVNNNTFSGSVQRCTFSGELYNSTFSGNLTNSMITGQFYGNTITASGSNTGTMNNIYTYGYIVNKTITVPNSSYMPTYVAMNTSNVLKVWNPADLVS